MLSSEISVLYTLNSCSFNIKKYQQTKKISPEVFLKKRIIFWKPVFSSR